LLSSKEVLEKTGISRATLNNYIASGIVPRPEVLPPEPSDGAAPRIGYFPSGIVDLIEEIQRLKREGWSITRITEHFTGGATPVSARATAAAPQPVGPATAKPRADAMPGLSLQDTTHPAYFVDNRFELIWRNEAAAALAWPDFAAVAPESRQAVLRLHVGLARQRGISLAELCRGVPEAATPVLERLYHQAAPFDFPMVVRTPLTSGRPGATLPLFLYALSFREGIFFVYVPGDTGAADVSALLAQPVPATEAASGNAPSLTQVAVLVTGLQESARLWSELPPEEYFELVNEIWLMVDPIFKRYHGTAGRHPGEGMACYFLPRADSNYLMNALAAACQVREAIRRLSAQWQSRKGWATELTMNTGIAEGQEWLGQLRPGPQAELTVLGDAANHAAGISAIARDGAVWVTRNLVGKLRAEERSRLKYGVRRRNRSGDEVRVASVFSRAEHVAGPDGPVQESSRAIARLPITEVMDFDPPPDFQK
jgi:adenylate cyclase